jgi:hypothetical protein
VLRLGTTATTLVPSETTHDEIVAAITGASTADRNGTHNGTQGTA